MQLDKVIQQNASAAEEMSSTAEEISSQSEEVASTAEELAGQAEQMQQAMSFFKLNGAASGIRLLEDATTRVAAGPMASARVAAPQRPRSYETQAKRATAEQPLLTLKGNSEGGPAAAKGLNSNRPSGNANQLEAVTAPAGHMSNDARPGGDDVDKDFEEY